MKTAELRHFGLKSPPFTKEIDDMALWLPTSKNALVGALVDAMTARESVLLTGEPGVGKTCVLRALRQPKSAPVLGTPYGGPAVPPLVERTTGTEACILSHRSPASIGGPATCSAVARSATIPRRYWLVADQLTFLEILDAWDLLDEGRRIDAYSMSNWRSIAEALSQCHDPEPAAVLGSVLPGLHQAAALSEGRAPIEAIAPHLVMNQSVWLPDPLYTFLVRDSTVAWKQLPESGNSVTETPAIYTNWRQLWDFRAVDRQAEAARHLSPVLDAIRKMRPLLEAGVARLFAWEQIAMPHLAEIRTCAQELIGHELAKSVTIRFKQDRYNLGIRLGSLSIRASDDTPPGSGLKPGQELHIVDISPVLVFGLLNATVSARLAAAMLAELPGDRDVHDFVMTGGVVQPETRIAPTISLPRFGAALLDDVIAIRENSHALGEIRQILEEASQFSEERILTEAQDRLRESAEKLRSDASLKKVLGDAATDFNIGAVVGTALGQAVGKPLEGAVIGSLSAGAKAFITKVLKSRVHPDGRTKRHGAEILLRVADRLDADE